MNDIKIHLEKNAIVSEVRTRIVPFTWLYMYMTRIKHGS